MKDNKKNRTRNKIIETALKEFAANGIGTTAFDNIAVNAGIARRTLYYHFGNKEELLQAIIDPRLEEGISEVRKFKKNETGITEVAVFCLRFWRAEPYLFSLFRKLMEEKISDFSILHSQFIGEFSTLFSRLNESEKMRFKDEKINIYLVFFSLFPLLEIISNEPDCEKNFIDIFTRTLTERK